jgi:hypothetical protein
MSTEHGPILRRGTTTTNITPIGTTASGTGLPTESTTTSFANDNVGTASGHDQGSGFSGLRQSGISLVGGGSVVISYLSLNSTNSGNEQTLSTSAPNNVITNNNAGISLPTPVGKHFKMIGYYVTGAVYESFVVTGSPTPSSTTNPNTGHALINTYVANIW